VGRSIALDSNQDRIQVHQLVAGLKEGVILLDLERKFLWANDAALAMHGLDDQKQLGTVRASTSNTETTTRSATVTTPSIVLSQPEAPLTSL